MGLEIIKKITDNQEQSETVSDRLWARATCLTDLIQTPLIEYQTELYYTFQQMQLQTGATMDAKARTEQTYWRISNKVQKIGLEIEVIMTSLSSYEAGKIKEEELIALLPIQPKNDDLENRRAGIEKAVNILVGRGIDMREILYEAHLPGFGTDEYHFEGEMLGTDVLSGSVNFTQERYQPDKMKLSNHRTKDGRHVRRR